MAFTRRNTGSDATWARAWTADTLADLTGIAAITGTETPHHGDIAYVTSTGFYYLWMDNGTWAQITGLSAGASITSPILIRERDEPERRLAVQQILGQGNFKVISDTSTGAVTNWAPALNGNTVIEWSGSSDVTFQGLTAGFVGQIVAIKNTGSHNAFFIHASLTTTAAQFTNIVTKGNGTPIAPAGYIYYFYDGTSWQLVNHHQGSGITPAFSAGDFTTDTGTWTVTAGEVFTHEYYIRDNLLFFILSIQATSVASSPTQLRIAVPNGYLPAASNVAIYEALDAGTAVISKIDIPSALNAFVRAFANIAGTAWQTSTLQTYVLGSIEFPLQ